MVREATRQCELEGKGWRKYWLTVTLKSILQRQELL